MFVRLWPIAVALLFLGACATPDIDRFAEQSGRLASTVSSETSETSRHLSVVAAQAGDTFGADAAADISRLAAQYRANASIINNLLDEAADYADAIASLAAAGETGGQAVRSLADSAAQFGSATGILVPGAELASRTVLDVASAVGKAWTRIEAQNDLKEVVATVAGPDGPVTLLAQGIAEIYGRGGPQQRLITEIADLERVLIRRNAGEQMIGLYEQLVSESLESMYADTRLTCFDQEEDALNRDCMTDGRFQSLAAVHEIVANLEPRYQHYARQIAELDSWESRRLSTADTIVRTVNTWKSAHERIAEELDACSGWRPFSGGCGELGSHSLKAAVDTLKSLVEED